MENSNNDIKNYTSEDIARYWQGKMSVQEMHALESAAMDDPFLADALEGYSAVQPAVINTDVRELNERLASREQHDKKVIPFKWWRAAAILIFLGGAAVLTYWLMQQNTSASLAKNEAAPQSNAADTVAAFKADSNIKDQAARETIDSSSRAFHLSPEAKQNAAVEKSEVAELNTQKSFDTFQRDLVSKDADDRAKMDSQVTALKDKETADALQRRVSGITTNNAPVATQENHELRSQDNAYYFNNFSGRVLDQRNNAIPFASVRVNNNNQAASTNADGYFNIKSQDTVLDVSINSIGFQPRQLTLRGNQPLNNITLDEVKSKMSEVVVTGNGISSPKKKSAKPDLKVYVMDAQPIGGWEEYNKYLANNKHAIVDKDVTGEVIVSFWVSKRGNLSDFTIEKSLGKEQDAEAIRLIKDGPEWEALKGKKTRARVIVTF